MLVDIPHYGVTAQTATVAREERRAPISWSPIQAFGTSTISGAGFRVTLDKKSFLDSAAYIAAQREELHRIADLAVRWKKYLLKPDAPVDVDALSETVDAIYDAIDRFGPGSIDLTGLTGAQVNGEHLAVILRASIPFRTQIPGWSEARAVAVEALQIANIPVGDVLAGIG